MFTQSVLLAVSMQFFTVTHHEGVHHPMAHSVSQLYGTNVEYLLDPHYEVGDTVLVLYDDDEIVYEKKFDLFKKY